MTKEIKIEGKKEREGKNERTRIEIFILRHVRSSGKISADKGANTVLLCNKKTR